MCSNAISKKDDIRAITHPQIDFNELNVRPSSFWVAILVTSIDHDYTFFGRRARGTLLKAITSTSTVKTGKSRKSTVAAFHVPSQALIAELLEMALGQVNRYTLSVAPTQLQWQMKVYS